MNTTFPNILAKFTNEELAMARQIVGEGHPSDYYRGMGYGVSKVMQDLERFPAEHNQRVVAVMVVAAANEAIKLGVAEGLPPDIAELNRVVMSGEENLDVTPDQSIGYYLGVVKGGLYCHRVLRQGLPTDVSQKAIAVLLVAATEAEIRGSEK
jgi:hypothetical protein